MWEFKLTRLTLIRFLVPVVLCLAIPVILMSLTAWEAASPQGTGDFDFAVVIMMGAIFCLLIIPAFIMSCIGLAYPRWRLVALICLASMASLFIGFLTGGYLGQNIRMHALAQLAERSKPLITAIEKYEQKFGRPPDSLDALAPEFISKVPPTGIGATPEYHFLRLTNGVAFGKNPWVLEVDHAAGPFFAFDTFIYLPRQNYSELSHEYKSQIRKIGDWAYWYQG
jgi:hypothetical protein